MKVGLLDVNMLIALAWPSHVHHSAAHQWFERNAPAGWATCPLTQCGFVRISCNSIIIPDAVSPPEAGRVLRQITAHGHHQFWHDSVPLPHDGIPLRLAVGHRQITDAYLLGLAIHHHGRLVTLDRGIRALLPAGHADAVVIVPAG